MNIKKIMCITAAATLSLSISGMTPKGSGQTLFSKMQYNTGLNLESYAKYLNRGVATVDDTGKVIRNNYFKAAPRLILSPAGICVLTEGANMSGLAEKALNTLPLDNNKKETIQYFGNMFKRATRTNVMVAGLTLPIKPVNRTITDSCKESALNISAYMVGEAISKNKRFKAVTSYIKKNAPKAITNHVEKVDVPFGEIAKLAFVCFVNYWHS
ncbi:MAG TPA: hypothetical protein VGW78_05915 [Candidatus Babeliales bacterium]|jgi:hypothetical protein|nr:hypothetical protein [Candidatus Babeliales bacterium]